MAAETKIVKGGFRATLALVISIIALVLAMIAVSRDGGKDEFRDRVRELQTKIEKLKQDSSERLDALREETSKTLEKMGKAVKKQETTAE